MLPAFLPVFIVLEPCSFSVRKRKVPTPTLLFCENVTKSSTPSWLAEGNPILQETHNIAPQICSSS